MTITSDPSLISRWRYGCAFESPRQFHVVIVIHGLLFAGSKPGPGLVSGGSGTWSEGDRRELIFSRKTKNRNPRRACATRVTVRDFLSDVHFSDLVKMRES